MCDQTVPSALGYGEPAERDRSVSCDRATYLTAGKGVEAKEEIRVPQSPRRFSTSD